MNLNRQWLLNLATTILGIIQTSLEIIYDLHRSLGIALFASEFKTRKPIFDFIYMLKTTIALF